MKYAVGLLMIMLLSGCATWSGIKKDANTGAEWSKDKVNQGASYVKEKTD